MDLQLRQISTLVQERRYDDARAALQPYLREHPDAANGWFLLSFAAETPAAKKQAIQKALQLAPDNERYMARAAKLGAGAARSLKVPLIVGGLVVVVVLAVALFSLRPAATPDTASSLPTLAVADVSSATPQETAEIVIHASPTPKVIALSPIATEITSATSAKQTTVTPPFEPGDIGLTAESGLPLVTPPTVQASVVNPPLATAPIPSPQSLGGTQQPTQSLPLAPSSTPSQTPQPGVLTATPVLTGDTGVAIGTALDIGTGSMRVVSLNRPGSSFITEMGGQAAAVPTGQDWVVVEVIVICAGKTNCAPSLSDLHVVSASGATYAPAPDFSMPQLFGPGAFTLGQVWGYMGFRVPTSDAGLSLVLSQGDKTYRFGLQ
ncbi:MAG: hypothetical protein ABI690_26820 [Chloroflexota bacterium]